MLGLYFIHWFLRWVSLWCMMQRICVATGSHGFETSHWDYNCRKWTTGRGFVQLDVKWSCEGCRSQVTQYGRESAAVRKLADTVTAGDASYVQMYLIDWSVCNVLCGVGRCPLHQLFFPVNHVSPIQQNAPCLTSRRLMSTIIDVPHR